MAGVTTNVPCKMASVEAQVTRCGCTDEQKASPKWHRNLKQPCPRPKGVEDRGVVSYYHRNIFKLMGMKLRIRLRHFYWTKIKGAK